MKMRGRLAVAVTLAVAGFLIGLAVYNPGMLQRRSAADGEQQSASALWLLAVGVSRYTNPALNLRYADADAGAFAEAFEAQRQHRLYRDVRVLVVTNEQATRQTILDGINRFLGQARADDVVAIFIAGHGVRDLHTGGYYFLPSPAGGGDLETAGLHMSAVAEAIGTLRRRVRTVVVMLDTCHAGALAVSGAAWERIDAPAGGLAPSEDLFILAATKPGEESREDPALGHGAFSYALLQGIAGAADADGDGLVALGELFAYVAREVPRLTGSAQHPYYRIEGSDIAFVAVDPDRARPGAPPNGFVPPPIVVQPTRDSRDTVGVAAFDDLRSDPQHAWVGQALRLAFNTELSKLDALRVYAPELIDLTAREHGVDTMAAARQLAIGRVITGSYSVVDSSIRVDARIIDVSTGVQEGSDSVEGPLEDFFDLQKRLVLRLLQRLQVRVSPAEGAAIGDAEHMNIDAYRLLLESEDAIEDPGVRGAPTPPASLPSAPGLSLPLLWPPYSTAYAAEAGGVDVEAVRGVLAAYRTALQDKDLDGLAALYVAFSPSRRAAQKQYFDNAVDLEIEIADIVVEPHTTGLVVSYTRRDRFTDRASQRAVRLEVRLTRIFVRDRDTWKIGGKP